MSGSPVLRFAPSPNGYLHLGHAYSGLLNAAFAKTSGGRFLLRIEDIDVTRCTKELTASCLDDLTWLGLTSEQPVRIQSEHWEDYSDAFKKLKARGLVYPCFCSRTETAARSHAPDPDGSPLYAGTCRERAHHDVVEGLASGLPHCWRIDMTKALEATGPEPLRYTRFSPFTNDEQSVTAEPQKWGDVILVRKEIPTSYHLSVVIDDALQGITHVVRGKDLEEATSLHRLLQALFGLLPPIYHHHELLKTAAGDKLSKSKGHEALRDLRKRGVTAEEIRQICAAGYPAREQ